MPPYNHTLFWEFFSDAVSGFAVTFVMPFGHLLQGMARAMDLSCFLLASLRISLIFSSSGSIKANSSESSSIVELWLFFCPSLFVSILSGFTNFRPYFWPYMIWSGSRLNLCQSLPGPHISVWRFLLQ